MTIGQISGLDAGSSPPPRSPARLDPPPTTARSESAIRSVGRGTMTLVISTILFVLLGFFSRVTIARVVTVAQWGEFSLGLALSSLLSIVIALGVPSAVSRSLSYEATVPARWRIVRISLIVSVASAVGGTFAIYFAAPYLAAAFHDANLTLVFQLFSPAIGFGVMSTILAAYFQGIEKVGPNALYNQVVNPGLFLAFLGVALFVHAQFVGVLLAYAASAGAALAALAVHTWMRLPSAMNENLHKGGSVDPTGHVSLLSMTVTLFGAGSLNLLTQYADTLILGVFWSTAVVGLYSAGMTLARLFLAGSSALLYIYLPVSTRLRRTRDFASLRESYVTSARWVTMMTLPLFCVFFFVPGGTLSLVFGASYTSGVTVLRILALASFASVIVGPANAGLSGLGHPRANLAFAAGSLVVNVGLSLALIPTWGSLGAAIAWSVARLLYVCLCLAYLWVAYQVSPFAGHYIRPLVASLVILAPAFLLLPHGLTTIAMLPVLAAFAFAVALLTIPLTRSVENGDLVLLGSVEHALKFKLPGLRRFLEARRVAPTSPVTPVA